MSFYAVVWNPYSAITNPPLEHSNKPSLYPFATTSTTSTHIYPLFIYYRHFINQ